MQKGFLRRGPILFFEKHDFERAMGPLGYPSGAGMGLRPNMGAKQSLKIMIVGALRIGLGKGYDYFIFGAHSFGAKMLAHWGSLTALSPFLNQVFQKM